MTVDEEVMLMEKQILQFNTLLLKLQWLTDFCMEYSQEARDIVRSNISKMGRIKGDWGNAKDSFL